MATKLERLIDKRSKIVVGAYASDANSRFEEISDEISSLRTGKQDILTAGENITIEEGVISAHIDESDISSFIGKFETKSDATGKFNTLDEKFSLYDTISDAESKYLKITDAASTYETISDANSKHSELSGKFDSYYTESEVDSKLSEYVTTSDASSTYLTISDASSKYYTKSDAASLEAEVSDHASSISGIQSALSSKADQSDVDSLDGRIVTLESDVASIDAKVATLESDVESIDVKISGIESDVASLNIGVVALESDIASLNASIGAIESDVDLLDDRVQTLEGRPVVVPLNSDNAGAGISIYKSESDETGETVRVDAGYSMQDTDASFISDGTYSISVGHSKITTVNLSEKESVSMLQMFVTAAPKTGISRDVVVDIVGAKPGMQFSLYDLNGVEQTLLGDTFTNASIGENESDDECLFTATELRKGVWTISTRMLSHAGGPDDTVVEEMPSGGLFSLNEKSDFDSGSMVLPAANAAVVERGEESGTLVIG